MRPEVTQIDTRQVEYEAALRLYGEREARAQRALSAARSRSSRGLRRFARVAARRRAFDCAA